MEEGSREELLSSEQNQVSGLINVDDIWQKKYVKSIDGSIHPLTVQLQYENYSLDCDINTGIKPNLI